MCARARLSRRKPIKRRVTLAGKSSSRVSIVRLYPRPRALDENFNMKIFVERLRDRSVRRDITRRNRKVIPDEHGFQRILLKTITGEPGATSSFATCTTRARGRGNVGKGPTRAEQKTKKRKRNEKPFRWSRRTRVTDGAHYAGFRVGPAILLSLNGARYARTVPLNHYII